MSNYLTNDGLEKNYLLPEAPPPEACGICHICHVVNPALVTRTIIVSESNERHCAGTVQSHGVGI